MLCDRCRRKQNCLPALFAKKDPTLQKMLELLKRCELRVEE
jgi:hypothetical protein